MSAARRIRAPLVGITCEVVVRRKDGARDLVCDARYAEAVKEAGGHPVLLPVARRRDVLARYLEGIDGLVIVGGDDVDPALYGEAATRATRTVDPWRARFESSLYRAGRLRGLPILGICYGMQLINVLEGGTLQQDLRRPGRSPHVDHRGRAGDGTHEVEVVAGTRLAAVVGSRRFAVATEHHQAVRRLGRGMVPAAFAADGVVEAIERPGRHEVLAVQWHPERRLESRPTRRLFAHFVRSCAAYRAGQER